MRVLVIDDEKNLADTLVWILERAGFEATSAYDGESALQRLDTFQPDIVISDVIMPGVNGIEVCTRIQARFPKCHILLFSGQTATNELLGEAREHGLTWELLAKPMDPDELLAKVTSLAQKSESAGV
jgi:DNA-binding response OmpR family regulator